MEKIMPYLQELAKQLGVAVEYVWTILVKQAIVNGIGELIMSGVCIISLLIIAICVPKIIKKLTTKYNSIKSERINKGYNNSSDFEDVTNASRYILVIASIILSVSLMVQFTIHTTNGIKQVYNPEYYAIQDVLKAIGE